MQNNIENTSIDLRTALEERYLSYALSTIMNRALPDVRDGLKPVHRRIIYAMHLLKLSPKNSYAKCARIVGDVMGKFHPHGDGSIYDALVRLAQDFSMRYILIDGQGNFGNIDGDNAAAMRYTEARMTDLSSFLLEGLEQNAVDFRATYNEEDEEPMVLPSAFPNILANGATGIAVGMATSIPPHNIVELCDACLHLLKQPDASIADLMKFIKGPDLPTGGILITNQKELIEAYSTGRGSFRLRAKWHKEAYAKNLYNIVITEIPFQVQKNRLVTKVQDLVYAKKIPMIEDIRDESTEDIRIVIEPKSKNINAELLMESLFKISEFESRISLNMNVLSYGKIPNVLSLKDILVQWLQHRQQVLQRKTKFRLNNIKNRLELLAGYLIAYLNIDEVISIIREEDTPKPVLIHRFTITDLQAEAILNMRLRSLRKLEEFELKKEDAELRSEQDTLNDLLTHENKQWNYIGNEIKKLAEHYSKDTRKTTFGSAPECDLQDIEQAMIEKEPVTIIISKMGWARSFKGHTIDKEQLSYKEGDIEKFIIQAYTTDKLIIFTTDGKAFTLNVNLLPGGRGHGDPIKILFDIENKQDIVEAFIYNQEKKAILVSSDAYGFIIDHKDLLSNTKKGKQIINVKEPNKLACCKMVEGNYIAIIGENRRMLIFTLANIPEMKRGKGVRLQKYREGKISDIVTFDENKGLCWKDSSGRTFNKTLNELEEWKGSRANIGRMAPRGFPKSNKFY